MKLFEYQAKEAFREKGLPTPKGVLVRGMDELDGAFAEVGFPCVLKSQVLSGGRGKAGLIKVVKDAESAKATAKTLFESEHNVRMLLVEEAVDIDREIYLSITVDPVESKIMLIGCAEGGVEIEKLAGHRSRQDRYRARGHRRRARRLPRQQPHLRLGLSGDLGKQVGAVVRGRTRPSAPMTRSSPKSTRCSSPRTARPSRRRQAHHRRQLRVAPAQLPPYPRLLRLRSRIRSRAGRHPVPPVQRRHRPDVRGAGLTTTVFDLINDAGGHPATYVEFGGANYTKAVRTMELCLKTPSKVILVVTFGTIARADVMAQGLVEAIKAHQPKQPIVTCIRGTNEEEAFAILRDAGLEPLTNTEEAVQRAVDIAAGRA